MMTLTLTLQFSEGVTKNDLSSTEKDNLKNALAQAFSLIPGDAQAELDELLKGESYSRNYVPGMNALFLAAAKVLKKYNDRKDVRCKFTGI